MNYEQAKKLKEAGFVSKHTGGLECQVYCRYETEGILHCPTFSELIEACGDSLERLEKSGDGRWHAKMTGSNLSFPSGSTPEEAVANLWIALNDPRNS